MFLIWDAIIPESTDSFKDGITVPLIKRLSDGDVETDYGVGLLAKFQIKNYSDILNATRCNPCIKFVKIDGSLICIS